MSQAQSCRNGGLRKGPIETPAALSEGRDIEAPKFYRQQRGGAGNGAKKTQKQHPPNPRQDCRDNFLHRRAGSLSIKTRGDRFRQRQPL
jgi:hypothetical protein